ncbi:MAG: hypothetical protein ACPKM0_09580 [Pleomorphochaeta sp.]
MEKIFKKITNLTVISYVALLIVFLLVFFIKGSSDKVADRNISTNILLGSTIFAVALPILFRTGYYNKSIKSKGLSQKDYYNFKLFTIISIFVGSLFALYGYYYPIYRYHLYIAILVSIWGLYSIFPSKKVFDKEIITYRVEK